MDFSKTVSENKSLDARLQDSVLVIPGLLRAKPTDDPLIGKAWPKKSKNGRVYYKMKFDCFVAQGGKSFYAKGWPRKSEPLAFDIHASELPAARYPLLLDKDGSFCFVGKPAGDGSYDLMLDHNFMIAD